jgi:hypothetical protein
MFSVGFTVVEEVDQSKGMWGWNREVDRREGRYCGS